jgi:hypothetical protein
MVVGLTARGVEGLLQPTFGLLRSYVCHFWRDSGPIYAWPPPTPPVFGSSLVLPGPGPDWQAEIAARNAAEREKNERAIAQLRERDRQRRERQLKEGKEAIAREVAERNRRNGWPY